MALSPNVELAVIDMAGTTVDDHGIVEAAVRAVTGKSFDPAVFNAYRGGSKLDMLGALVGGGRAHAALAEFEVHLLEAVESGAVEPLPHAQDALVKISGARIKTCLTTGFPTSIREALIKALAWEDFVDLTLSPGPGCRGRPSPDLILTAVLRLEVTDVAAVAVVGDTTNDVLAARRAGAGLSAAVLTGAHGRSELTAAEPSHLLDHIGYFADIIVGAQSP